MIRPMVTGDLNKVVALAKEMHQEGNYKDIPFSTEVFVRTMSKCMSDGFAWVGENEGKVVCGMMGTIGELIFSKALITNDLGLFVSKEYRKSRLGLKLINKFIEWSKEMGATEICISHSNGHKGGLGKFLTKSLGFECVGELYKLRN